MNRWVAVLLAFLVFMLVMPWLSVVVFSYLDWVEGKWNTIWK